MEKLHLPLLNESLVSTTISDTATRIASPLIATIPLSSISQCKCPPLFDAWYAWILGLPSSFVHKSYLIIHDFFLSKHNNANNPYDARPMLAAQQLGASIKISSFVALKRKPTS